MKTDPLSTLILSVGDDSPGEHKAMFLMWSALDDIANGRTVVAQLRAARAIDAAASALPSTQTPEEGK